MIPVPIKAVIIDGDGIAIVHHDRFSDRLAKDFGITSETTAPFFAGPFRLCRVGKADLKQELFAYYEAWGWKGSLDELIEYWFTKEGLHNEEVLAVVQNLRAHKVPVFLATDNEKYRTDYLMQEFGLMKRFDAVLSSASIGFTKEEPGFWQYVVKHTGYKPEEMLVWDDEEENILPAKAAGFITELFTDVEDFKAKVQSYFPKVF